MIPKVGDIVKFNPLLITPPFAKSRGCPADNGNPSKQVVRILGPDKDGDFGMCVEGLTAFVFWVSPPDGRWFTMPVGSLPLFILVAKTNAGAADPVPRNNDGRDTCFWCRIPTAKRGGGAYDVCPKCGR